MHPFQFHKKKHIDNTTDELLFLILILILILTLLEISAPSSRLETQTLSTSAKDLKYSLNQILLQE